MNRKDLKLVRKICDKLDMTLTPEGKGIYDLSFGSNLGEDFHISIQENKKENQDFMYALAKTTYDFDPEEHATMWWKARHTLEGIPSSIRDLLEDADYILEQLETFEKYCKRYFHGNAKWKEIKQEILNDGI